MSQIIFNSKKSYEDLKIFLESFSIGSPSKKKIKESVPFMNSSYDFSTVGSAGEVVYTERPIKAIFHLKEKDRGALYNKYSEVLEWLLGTGQKELIITDLPDCYYLAEVEEAPSFESIIRRAGRMEVNFIAEPFKYGTTLQGSENLLWDGLNFESDYLQDTEFDITGSKVVQIYNPGRTVVPTVNCNSSMIAQTNGYTANFIPGDNKDYRFKLINGLNTITLTGTGHVKILFRKELL